jgi:hypothetical protein
VASKCRSKPTSTSVELCNRSLAPPGSLLSIQMAVAGQGDVCARGSRLMAGSITFINHMKRASHQPFPQRKLKRDEDSGVVEGQSEPASLRARGAPSKSLPRTRRHKAQQQQRATALCKASSAYDPPDVPVNISHRPLKPPPSIKSARSGCSRAPRLNGIYLSAVRPLRS